MFLSAFALAKYFGIGIWKILKIDLRIEHRGNIENSVSTSSSGSYEKCGVKATHTKNNSAR